MATSMAGSDALPIVPRPQRLGQVTGTRRLQDGVLRVSAQPDLVHSLAGLSSAWAGPPVIEAARDAADVVVETAPGFKPDLPGDGPSGLDPSRGSGHGGRSAIDADGEGYQVLVDGTRLMLRAAGERGAFRGLTTILQAIGAGRGGELPLFTVVDGPAMRWRGLSLDVARRFFPLPELKAVIDLLAYYRLGVLHLHLTSSHLWRLRLPNWPALTPVDEFYSDDEIGVLASYAQQRQVMIVPEIDMPGHMRGVLAAYPELGGDEPPAHLALSHLRPGVEAAMRFAREAVDVACRLCPTPYVHVGGDEAFGMDPTEYTAFATAVRGWVRERGKLPVAWQEASRARAFGPGDMLQLWITEFDAQSPEVLDRVLPHGQAGLRDMKLAFYQLASGDLGRALDDGAWVLLSPSFPFYLDRRYAEASRDPDQADLMTRLGHPGYPPERTSELYQWKPRDLAPLAGGAARIAGAEAVVWSESITGVDDLAALLLPRLPVLAEMMWVRERAAWSDLAGRISAHVPVWSALGFDGYYRSADVFA